METSQYSSGFRTRSGFKSHHSGMETASGTSLPEPLLPFKSHHSGMETWKLEDLDWEETDFKSHHSGMETEGPRPWFWPEAAALNRTIVGWKLRPWNRRPARPAALNRTIVGWKRKGRPVSGSATSSL